MLLTPFIMCTHMWLHWTCWKSLQYPDAMDICCFNLCLHVHTSCVSSNIVLQNLVRDCVVDLVWVQLLHKEWEDNRCWGWWFFLLLILGWSEPVSSVVASSACWLIYEVGYCMHHRWKHWLLVKVGRLVILLEHVFGIGVFTGSWHHWGG